MPFDELDEDLARRSLLEAKAEGDSVSSIHASKSEQACINKDSAAKYPPTLSLRPKRKNVRTGCLTCKIRKVKCDEEKPECRRCKSTGRKCDGYAPPMSLRYQQKNQVVATSQAYRLPHAACSIYKVPSDHPGLRLEVKTFQFVQSKTISALSGYFHSNFWSRLLSQPNNLEPTIWHAVLAVGTFHELTLTQGNPYKLSPVNIPSTPEMTFALYHYTEAISLLRENMNLECPPLLVVLTTCLLFVYLEFLRCDFETASKQINSGINIIKQSIQTSSITKSSTSIHSLVQQFNSLGILGTLLGQPPNCLEPIKPESQELPTITTGFTSIAEARASILDIVAVILPFVQIMSTPYRSSREDPPIALQMKKLELECHLEAWSIAFERFMGHSRAGHLSFSGIRATKVLKMQHAIASIWLDVAFAAEEAAFDAYIQKFEEIVSLGEDVTSTSTGMRINAQQHEQPLPITFELGIIPPLYWTAVKCRDPIIRRRALYLIMHKTPRQEGMWFAKQAASVACRVIEIEEGRKMSNPLDGPDEKLIPPESARVRRGLRSEEADKLPSSCTVKDLQWTELMLVKDEIGTQEGRYVTFEMPGDLPGEPQFRREYIRYLDCG